MTGISVSFSSSVSSNFFNSYTFKRERLVCSGGLVISFYIFGHLPTHRNYISTNVTLFFPKLCCCLSLYWEKLFSTPPFLVFYKVPYAQVAKPNDRDVPRGECLQDYSKLLLPFVVGHEALSKGECVRIPYQNLLVCYGKSMESFRICKVIRISWHLHNNKSCTYFRSFWLQDANPHVLLLNKSNCCH